MTLTDDDVINAIRAADPARTLEPDAHAMHELLHAVSTQRRWRPVALSAAIAGALALGAASPAIAHGVHTFLAQTGWFGSSPNPPGVGVQGGDTPDGTNTESDDSEWIMTDAADYVDYSVSVFPDYITLPAQYDRDAFARAIAISQQAGYPEPGLVQTTSIVQTYELYAYCAALDDWLDTSAASDVAILTAGVRWPATISTDIDGVVPAMLGSVATAAREGNRDAVLHYQRTNCPSIPASALTASDNE
jgi:hypothetical protein